HRARRERHGRRRHRGADPKVRDQDAPDLALDRSIPRDGEIMPESTPRFTLITAARLLDGSSSPPLTQAALLVEHGAVVRMGAAADVRAPDGAAVDRRGYREATHSPRAGGSPPRSRGPGPCPLGGCGVSA